jgi:outer membrane autotransporter protein
MWRYSRAPVGSDAWQFNKLFSVICSMRFSVSSSLTLAKVTGAQPFSFGARWKKALSTSGLLPLVVLFLLPGVAFADPVSTWIAVGPGDWNDTVNWSNMVPTGTASFGTLTGTTVTFAPSPTAPVDTLQFGNGAPTFHFNLGAQTLTIVGRGIVVSPSSNAPAFTVVSLVKTTGLFFQGFSTAGNASITLMGGSVQFSNTSSADASIIMNNGGLTQFSDTSNAGNSSITNNAGGDTSLVDSRTAANAAINKDGVTNGGLTQFNGGSNAGSSTITNNKSGSTFFFDSSTGGRARFINNSGGIFDISNLTSGGMTAGSIEGAGGYFLGSKTLTVGLNNLSTEVSGIISDGGTNGGRGGLLSKVGTGTLTLTGLNTYSGGTNLSGGTVAVDSEANLGTGGLSFQGGTLEALVAGGGINSSKVIALNEGGGTFLADGGTTSTLSGATIGVGGLSKDGPGRLILTGANTYSGGTVLKAGILTVHGANALGLGNVVVNGGILNADPQTINVKGNYTQTAGGTLQLQVAGASPGQYDSLNVGGNATLDGTLQLISLGFQPKAGNRLTLVNAGGGVSGRFAQFEDPFATGQGFNSVLLLYGRNTVILEFLDQELAGPVSPLSASLQEISPEDLTAFYEISFSNANIQRLNLESRLDDIRSGSNGFSSNMTVNGASVNLEERVDADGKSSKTVVEPILQHTPENRWGVWMTGFGDFVSVDGNANTKGYDFTTGGVSLGLDYRLTDQLVIGVMGEYSHTWTALQPSGHIDVDSGRGGLYATWYNRGLYFNGAIYGGHNNYDSNRVNLGGLATGDTEGAEWSAFVSAGYDFHFGHLTVGPIASLQYTYVNIDEFSEKGSLLPLEIHSGSAESLRSDAGLRAFCQWQIGKILVEPSLRAAWEHEYKYSALPLVAGFAGTPGPATTFFGPSEGHDSAVVSAGVSVQWTPSLTTYVNYDGQLGRDNYDSNAVTGGISVRF